MDVFTQKEKDLIEKEYLQKNVERNNGVLNGGQN